MAPSIVYTRASTSLTTTSNPSVLRFLTASSTKRQRAVSARNLWWWSRHGTWSSPNDETFDERMLRHQKILRHRYSRALRRRAMWERDDTVPSWPGRTNDGRSSRRLGGCRTVSSMDTDKSRLKEKQDDYLNQQEYWAQTKKDFAKFDQDFESFKAAVDRAIMTDPYGTLFGRRLQSPPSTNNASWISWLFNRDDPPVRHPTGVKSQPQAKKIEIEVLDKDDVSSAKSSASLAVKVEEAKPIFDKSAQDMEYTYDPISGRKVPRAIKKVESAKPQNKTILETLFSEHGSAPDKPVKQRRVYGHDSQSARRPQECVESENAESGNPQRGFESSRMREFRQLRASTVGNSIHTTAEFGGKFENDRDTESSQDIRSTRKMIQHDEDTPLFAGTAYEAKAEKIAQAPKNPKSTWLEKEGFRAQDTPTTGDHGTKPIGTRLEPSFDRMQHGTPHIQQGKFIFKLQPAVDRIQVSKPREMMKGSPTLLNVSPIEQTQSQPLALAGSRSQASESEQREDVDLLRASDVRAATRVARTTKQEAAQAKTESRSQLETKFDKVHNETSGEVISDAKQLRADSGRLSRDIDSVEKHVEKYPNGVVAKTMAATGMAFKTDSKPYSARKVDLTERLEFANDSLDKLPSIYKPQTERSLSQDTSVAQSVMDEQKAREELTRSQRIASQQANDLKRKEDVQIEQLAKRIRDTFETEQGPIDLSYNPILASKVEPKDEVMEHVLEHKASADGSVEFFHAKQQFLSEVNNVSQDIKLLREKTEKLDKVLQNKTMEPAAVAETAAVLMTEARSHLRKVEALHSMYDRSQRVSHPLASATVKPGVFPNPAIEKHTQVFEPRYVQLLNEAKSVHKDLQNIRAALHDLQRSRVARDVKKSHDDRSPTQEPESAAASHRQIASSKSEVHSSPYLILAYDKAAGEVQQTAMDRLPWKPTEKTEKTNAIRIMGSLNYPAAFVTHFVDLEKAGYELSSGGGDMLIFQKKVDAPTQAESRPSEPLAPASQSLRNMIAAEEASSQPEISETITQPKASKPKQAATVLDDIPEDIPQPGPSAPTAPPTNPLRNKSKLGLKVRRQEQVFSGTIPVRTASNPTNRKSGETETETHEPGNREEVPSIFKRTTRTLKRGVLGLAAFGAAAYTIGVVAEGIGAQAQIDGDAAIGPRRKMVMPVGQRPGIYSTESSRAD
ncbi:hypothetical protein R6Q59_010016 [Mikania micrantha]